MNRPFWMKLIVGIVAFMVFMQGILPTNVVFAGDEGFAEFYCTETGEYILVSVGEKSEPVLEYGAKGTQEIYYYDENGKKVAPENDGEGKIQLEAGKTYYYISTFSIYEGIEEGTKKISRKSFKLVNVNDAPWAAEDLENGVGLKPSLSDANYEHSYGDDASIIESLLTGVILTIGTALYSLVCLVVGDAFSIEKVIFNDYSNTRLGFFNNVKTNDFIESANVKTMLNEFYNFFNGITIVVYLIILVYMAIRIMLGSTAERGSKYKELILYWVQGVVILFVFPYVMKYAITINDSFISYIASAKDTYIDIEMPEADLPEAIGEGEANLDNFLSVVEDIRNMLLSSRDFMSVMYRKASESGWLVYAVCWFVMFFQMVGFLIVYFKRVLVVMFLIAIFPLVMISYAIDKIGDAKSQAFDNWVKEFTANVFLQSFHAISYVLIMSLICQLMDDPSENWLLILIAISFVSKGDDILRAIFAMGGPAGTIKGIGSSFAEAAAVASVTKSVKNVGSRLIGKESSFRKFTGKAGDYWQKYNWERRAYNANIKAKEIERQSLGESTRTQTVDLSKKTAEEVEIDIKKYTDILLGKKAGATDDEIRNAADMVTAYMNDKDNENTQNALNKIAKDYSKEDREKLDTLLKQNAAANALMVGGRNVNITNKIDIIIKAMEASKQNGKVSNESMAILSKVADSEDDLNRMKLFGGMVKFNKEKEVSTTKKNMAGRQMHARRYIDDNGYIGFAFRGRSAAQSMRENSEAKTELEYKMMNGNKAQSARTATRMKNANANRNMVDNFNGTQEIDTDRNMAGTQSGARPIDRRTYTAGNTEGTQSGARPAAQRTFTNRNTAGAQSNAQENVTNKNTTNSNTARRTYHFSNSNKASEVENDVSPVQEVVRNDYVSNANKVLEEMHEDYNNFGSVQDMATRDKFYKKQSGDDKTKVKLYSEETRKDFASASSAVKMLTTAGSGDYTAREILGSINSLKRTMAKYENASNAEQLGLQNIVDNLGCDFSDYEAFVRIKILNDPDSVGNNRKIIEECKEYVKNTEIPDIIKDKLAYDVNDLVENQNVKYIKRKDVENEGFVSESQKTRAQKEYEDELRRYNLDKEIHKLKDKKNNEYKPLKIAKDTWDVAKSAGETVIDSAALIGGAAGTGLVTTGLASGDGKKETLTQATQNFFTGYGFAGDFYDNTKKNVTGTAKEVKEALFLREFDKKEKKEKKNEFKGKAPKLDIEKIKNKTKIITPSFTDRGNS